jgi:hypothetical protein
VRHAQQILMIEAGRIIERGTHESLCAAGDRYYDLFTKQQEGTGGDSNAFINVVPQKSSTQSKVLSLGRVDEMRRPKNRWRKVKS